MLCIDVVLSDDVVLCDVVGLCYNVVLCDVFMLCNEVKKLRFYAFMRAGTCKFWCKNVM